MLRILSALKLKIGSNSSYDTTRFNNYEDPEAEVRADVFQKTDGSDFDIVAEGSLTLDKGDVTDVHGILIEADGTFTVSIDGGAAITIREMSSEDGSPIKRARFFADLYVADGGSIVIGNPDEDATLTGFYQLWGDPTAE